MLCLPMQSCFFCSLTCAFRAQVNMTLKKNVCANVESSIIENKCVKLSCMLLQEKLSLN